MKKLISLQISSLAVLLLLLVVPVPSQADTVIRTGETVSVADEAGVVGNFYAAASIVNISGKIEGDMVAAGGQTTLNGEVTEDVLIFGGSVDVHGPVGGDLRVVAGEVVIAEPVTGDVFVMGGNVSILSTASVGGDVVVYAGDVEIAGPVGGDIIGQSGTLRIDAAVAGNVDVSLTQLVLGDRAEIEGTVSYVSDNLVTRSQNAKVNGDIIRNDPVLTTTPEGLKTVLVPFLITLFTVLVWFLVSKTLLQKVVFTAVSKRPRPALLGLGTFFLAPFAIVILMVSVLGTLVGFIGLVMYLTLVLLALVATTAVTGQLILKTFNQPAAELTLFTLGAGVIGVSLALLIPVLGPFVIFGLFIVSLGALVENTLYPAK